ncbi:hypothetical protein G6F40_015499 [Rhizopus arrhizus]|nr:hypothetical protein G6F40_015499 [Rhizopus arrhizus]
MGHDGQLAGRAAVLAYRHRQAIAAVASAQVAIGNAVQGADQRGIGGWNMAEGHMVAMLILGDEPRAGNDLQQLGQLRRVLHIQFARAVA